VPEHPPVPVEPCEDLGPGEEVSRRGQRQILAADRRLVLAGELRLEIRERRADRVHAVDPDHRLARHVVEERREAAGVKAGEEGLEPEEGRPGVDGVEHLAHPRGWAIHPLRRIAHGLLGGLLRLDREERLPGGDDGDLGVAIRRRRACRGDGGSASLRLGVEALRALHLVTEELQADRPVVERAPQVDDAAADGEGARVLHQRHASVPERDQLGGERLAIDRDALPEQIGVGGKHGRGHHAARQGARRHHHRPDRGPIQVEACQRGEALHLQTAVRREIVVRKHRVCRDAQDRRGCARRGGQEEGEIARELLRLFLPRGDREQQSALGRADELARDPAPRGTREPGDVGGLALGEESLECLHGRRGARSGMCRRESHGRRHDSDRLVRTPRLAAAPWAAPGS
jgi:hypothetical protein